MCLTKPFVRFLALVVVMVSFGCHSKRNYVDRGIYYWKTIFTTKDIDTRLKDIGCRHIYLHCFDVVWNKEKRKAVPVGKVQFASDIDSNLTLTPVVFITQDVVRNIAGSDIKALAGNINKLLTQTFSNKRFSVGEIQLDCDWTSSSRDRYFELLKQLKQEGFFHGKQMSCTIRLHQIKYQISSGIPPVDKGLVMCYNIGNLRKPGTHNSILDPALAKDYLKNINSYPLKLDIALPLFSWCVQFSGNIFKGILRDIKPEQVRSSSVFRSMDKVQFQCKTDTSWGGYHFLKDDIIRIEAPSIDDIMNVANFTGKQLKNDSLAVVLFHADSLTLSKYSDNEIEAIYSAYH